MRWSKLFIPTLREDPADASLTVRLLRRAGYLRDAGYLPLGVRSLRKIASVVRRELDLLGGQELAVAGDVVRVATGELRSYRQLPQVWYQLATQALDGLLIDRENSLGQLRPMCQRIFERLGLPVAVAETVDGSAFIVVTEGGTEQFLEASEYRAVPHAAVSGAAPPAAADASGDLAPEPIHTPGQRTIADVARFLGVPETSLIKTLVMVADGQPVLVLLRGDHVLSESKVRRRLGAVSVRAAHPGEVERQMKAGAGSLGPVGVTSMRMAADHALRGRRNMICGANRDDYHLRNVSPGRDFPCDFLDLRLAAAGEIHPETGEQLVLRQGVIVGSVEEQRAGLRVLDEEGKETAPAIARAFIRFDRLLQAAVELGHDRDGLILPSTMAPFDVVVTPVNMGDPAMHQAAESIYAQCASAGLDAVLDDRDERPGVKFKDADLVGIPVRVTVGKKLVESRVEVVERRSKAVSEVPVSEAAEAARRILGGR